MRGNCQQRERKKRKAFKREGVEGRWRSWRISGEASGKAKRKTTVYVYVCTYMRVRREWTFGLSVYVASESKVQNLY